MEPFKPSLSAFEQLAAQISSLQVQLVDEHRREVKRLQHHIDSLTAISGVSNGTSSFAPDIEDIEPPLPQGIPHQLPIEQPQEDNQARGPKSLEKEEPKPRKKEDVLGKCDKEEQDRSMDPMPVTSKEPTASEDFFASETQTIPTDTPKSAKSTRFSCTGSDRRVSQSSVRFDPKPSVEKAEEVEIPHFSHTSEDSWGSEYSGDSKFSATPSARISLPVRVGSDDDDLSDVQSEPDRGRQKRQTEPGPQRDKKRASKDTDSIAIEGTRSEPLLSASEKKGRGAKHKVRQSVREKTQQLQHLLSQNKNKDSFKIRRIYNLAEEDLLRMKRKAEAVHHRQGFLRREMARGKSLFIVTTERDSFMIHPHSRKRLAWDVVALSSLLYDLITVPLLAFELPRDISTIVLSYLTCIFWTLDICLSFITGMYIEGQLEMRFKQVKRNYVRSWLPIDIMVTAPEWVTILLDNVGEATQSLSLLRLMRGSRVFRVLRLLKLIRLIKLSKVLQDLNGRIRDDALLLVVSISKLSVAMLILAHMLACSWYAVGIQPNGWAYVEGITDRYLADRYVYSFQWALARMHPSNMSENMRLVTVGERALAITSTMVAMIVLSVFISTMTNTMAEIKKYRSRRSRTLTVTRSFCRQHKISHRLVGRIKDYLDNHADSTNKNIISCEVELVTMLPAGLLMDLRHEAWSPVISRMDFFDSLHRKFRTTERDICHTALEEVPVFGGDTVFTTGAACSRMVFVVQGRLSYIPGMVMDCLATEGADEGTDNTCVEDVYPGLWLSEAVLWTPWENCGQLSSIASAVLLAVNVDPFIEVMKAHEHSMVDASVYGKAFVDMLNQTDPTNLTDLCAGLDENCFDKSPSMDLHQQHTASGRDSTSYREGVHFSEITKAKNPVVAWELSG